MAPAARGRGSPWSPLRLIEPTGAGQGRLRWVCVPPFQSIPDAIDEVRFGKEHGAVGIQLPRFGGNRLMTEPYFYPLFEEAERLDLPIVSHIANANPWMVDLFRAMYQGDSAVGSAFPVFYNTTMAWPWLMQKEGYCDHTF